MDFDGIELSMMRWSSEWLDDERRRRHLMMQHRARVRQYMAWPGIL